MSEATKRRSYGTGSLWVKRDSAGRECWYGQWRTNGRQVKRRVGPKRGEGSRAGLTRRQAEAELRRLVAETPAQPVLVGERLSIEELGHRYMRQLERQGRKKSTLVAVESILRCWLVPHFGDCGIDAIKPEDVEDLMRRMEAGGVGRRAARPVGAKSIRNYIGTLSALLNFALTKGWLAANPVRRIELPGIEHSEDIRFLDPTDVQALAQAAVEGPYQAVDRALYLTAAMTGLRQGELVALRWRDVDWRAGRIRVRQNHVLGEFGTPKSRRSTRSVPMADALAGALDRLFTVSRRQGDGDLVFGDPASGEPLSKAAILRRYRRALASAELDTSHRFHDLRHTFGTRMAAAGVPIRTLQEWMGHRDIETTQRYADYAPSPHEAEVVDAAFGMGGRQIPGTTESNAQGSRARPIARH